MDAKLKHLEMIQAIIARHATNSFHLKGWTVVLVASLFVLSGKDAQQSYIYLAYLPACVFWGIDAYYLAQERSYRRLYEQVRLKENIEIDFNLNPEKDESWLNAPFSVSILPFHLSIIVAITIVWFVQL